MVSGWSTSDRRSRLPADWPKRVAATRKRAANHCEWQRVTALLPWLPQDDGPCHAYGTDCDHIRRGDDHALDNLAWLCRDHHRTKTTHEAVGTRRALAAARTRPATPHPGLI